MKAKQSKMTGKPQRSVTGNTLRLAPDSAGIETAARLLAEGELVALPTETVYGLAADARQDHAVARIFEAKGRPRFNPLIIHVADLASAGRYARLTPEAERLARAFWPGPLTLVLPLLPDAGLSPLVTAGNDSVAVRVPAHPVAQALLRRFGGPLAAPSANPSGRVSPTRAAHVLDGLDGRIEAVIDGGEAAVGVESTIVGLLGAPLLLRPGGLALEDLEAALGRAIPSPAADLERPVAPGQLSSHYAPRAEMRLGTRPRPGEAWLGFGPADTGATLNLSPAGDLTEAAANLFHYMREIDTGPGTVIAVSPIPERGLGRAINDRLRRAAAPRPAPLP